MNQREKLIVLYNQTDDLSSEEKNRLTELFESTIDTYLAAKGVKIIDNESNRDCNK